MDWYTVRANSIATFGIYKLEMKYMQTKTTKLHCGKKQYNCFRSEKNILANDSSKTILTISKT